MADDPKLVVAITARLDQFEKAMKDAGLIAEREMRVIETKMGTVAGGVAAGTIIAKAIEKGVQAAVDEIQKLIDQMLMLGKVTKATGIDLNELQRIGFTTRVAGMADKDMAAGLESASQKMNEMNHHTTRLSELLDANNIKYRDQAGQVLKVSEGLELAATLMGRAKTEADKLEIARIFGLSQQWVAVLGEGVEKFRQMKGEAPVKELELSVAHMKALERLANEIKAVMGGWGSELVTNVLPVLEKVLGVLAAMAVSLSKVTVGGLIEGPATAMANNLELIHAKIKSALLEIEKKPIVVGAKPGVTFPERGGGGRDELERFDDQLSKHIKLLEAEAATLGQSIGVQEQARQMALLSEAAKRQGISTEKALTEARREQIALAGQLKQSDAERLASMQKLVDASRELGSALSEAFKGLVLEGQKLDEVLKKLANRMASKAIDKMFDLMFAPSAGGGLSTPFLQLLGRQSGGPVSSGRPYMVGEKGPELFVPKTGGMILPNSATRGGGGVQQTITVNDYSGHAQVQSKQSADGSGVEVFIPALEQMLASGVSRGRGALSKSVDARRRGTNLYG